MIISASRRCDIPAFEVDWFIPYIKKFKHNQLDCIVFWTKNPIPLMKRLDEIKGYNYYFQFTVTSYGQDIEPNVPLKGEVILPAFKELSERIGKEKVIWRYDPIFINGKYTKQYHYENFELLCSHLSKYTEKCIFSFIDMYGHCVKNMEDEHLQHISFKTQEEISMNLSKIASKYNIQLETCAEKIDLEKYGIKHGHCIDKDLIERITGKQLSVDKDAKQRKLCGCIESVDIGKYGNCKHFCKYCYATRG